METERRHLRAIEQLLDIREQSRLLFMWRAAGWLLGYLGFRAGIETYHRTIAAVETFVAHHYERQIQDLVAEEGNVQLISLLRDCQQDEVLHRDEAAQSVVGPAGWLSRLWCALVSAGSATAVAIARRV
jgi:ubiquinone biosynthesis monooxygenase Coq7